MVLILKWALTLLYVGLTLFLLFVTVAKAVAIENARRQWRRVWVAVVFGWATVAAGLNLVAVWDNSRVMSAIAIMSWGTAMLLVVSIPCGAPFFNKGYARLTRNLFFSAFGTFLLYQGVSTLLE